MSSLASKLESILFSAGRPVKLQELVRALDSTKSEVLEALDMFKKDRSASGVVLVEKDERYQLMTHPDNAKTVGNFLNAELREKLSDAALETLAVISYKQPISRAEIEAIRGVNSQYILRQLSMRGMVEKTTSTEDARRLVYSATLEFMASLGIKDLKDLPDFEELTRAVELPEAKSASDNGNTQENETLLDKQTENPHNV